MVRLRVLLAWIVLLAIPVQGLAAAPMLFCGMRGAQEGAGHHHPVNGNGEHLHALSEAPHQHDGAVASSPAQPEPQESAQQTGSAHKCSGCDACFHSVGITGPASVLSIATAPQPAPAAVLVVMHSRSTRVDDKPPRS